MRTRVISTLAAVVTAGALVVISAAPAQAHGYAPPSKSITATAVAASGGGALDSNPYDYDILIQALIATGLDKTLDGPGAFTVFAPNDAAFERTVSDLTGAQPASEQAALDALLALPDAVNTIKNILLGHVVSGRVLGPVSVLFAGRITMANGSVIRPRFLTLRDEDVNRPDPRLVLSAINIRCSNGVIHTIDRVLLPAGV